MLLLHRLRRVARVDARAAEEEQPADAREARRIEYRGLNHEIRVDEFPSMGLVSQDPADARRGEYDAVRPLALEKSPDREGIHEVERGPRRGEDVRVPVGREPSQERRADEAAVPGDVDPGLLIVALRPVRHADIVAHRP